MALSKKFRVKKKKDFDEIFKNGRFVAGTFLFLKSKKNNQAFSRAAVVVSSRIARKATTRNLIRRRIFSSLGPILDKIRPSQDMVLVINNPEASHHIEEIPNDLLAAIRKLKILT